MAEPRWVTLSGQSLARLSRFSHRRPILHLVVVLGLVLLGAWGARGLTLKADMSELLPRSSESTRVLEKARERLGGVGYVVVVLRGPEPEALRRAVDGLAPDMRMIDGIRYVDHRRDGEFLRDHALAFLAVDDLRALDDRLRAREAWELRKSNPLFVSLDEEDRPPTVTVSDLEERWAAAPSHRLAGNGETHYLDKHEGLAAIFLKPAGRASDLDFSRAIVDKVDRFMAKQDLGRFGPGITYAITGTFKKQIDQQAQITSDLALASTAAGGLMVLVLLLHFRGVAALLFVLLPVGAGLAWTYGFVYACYGSVNLLTGFLGAVLGGLGTEHGIHLYSRIVVLRREGKSSEDATAEAFRHVGVAALVSSLVAALTFTSLAFSDFRAFSEFGAIAAVGMGFGIAAYVLILPPLFGLLARLGWRPKDTVVAVADRSFLAHGLVRHARRLRWLALPLLAGLIALVPWVRFDYDFSSLEDGRLPSFVLDRKVNKLLGYSQTPTVILADDEAHERALSRAIEARRVARGPTSTVDFVAAPSALVPDQQAEKITILRTILRRLDRIDEGSLTPTQREQWRRLRPLLLAQPFGWDDLPSSLRRRFEDDKGHPMHFVLVYPRVSMSDGKMVRAFADEVRGAPTPDGSRVVAAGDPMILADIIALVGRESGPVLGAALLLVLLALWLTSGSLRDSLLCLSPTLFSVAGLLGLMVLAGQPFNFLNIIAVPVLVGTTVDAGVHLMERLRDMGDEDVGVVLAQTGRAICGGLMTSAVGFAALVLARHPGLQSLGELTILGFSLNLLVVLVIFPAVLLGRRRVARTTPNR